MTNGRTRFKLTLLLVGLGLAEGIVKTIWGAFPLTEVFAFQGLVAGWYVGNKSYTNVKTNGGGVTNENK